MTITSPHNEQLKQIRKLAGRKWRDKLRLFVAEGEDLIEAAARAWVGARGGLRRRRQRPRRRAGGAARAGRRLPARLRHPRARRLRAALGARARPRPAWPCGASTTPATSAPRCAPRSRSAPAASRSARAAPTPYGPKAVRASMGALFEVPVARVREPGELPGRTIALAARQGAARIAHAGARRRRDARGGAERDGAAGRRGRRVRRGGAHPDPVGVAERGDGGDRRPVRAYRRVRGHARPDRGAARAGRDGGGRLAGHGRAGGRPRPLPRPQGRAAEPPARRRAAAARGARRGRPRRQRGAAGAGGRDRDAPRGARGRRAGDPAGRRRDRRDAPRRPRPSRSAACT